MTQEILLTGRVLSFTSTPFEAAPEAAAHPGARPAGLERAREGGPDRLTLIKGIGPVNERKLNQLGIFHFDQIGAWKKKEVEWVGSYLSFPGRIEREEWIAQARRLAGSSGGRGGGRGGRRGGKAGGGK